MVPFDTESPMVTSGMRVGSAAITTRGFGVEECLRVVDWIDAILSDPGNDALIQNIKQDINNFMANFPLYEAENELTN